MLYLILFTIFSLSTGKELLPADCHCRDWYGGCRQLDALWTDDNIWRYRCSTTNGTDATFTECQVKSKTGQFHLIAPGTNKTVDGFWANCEVNDIRQKLEIEPRCRSTNELGEQRHIGEQFREGIFQWICLEGGRWVTGCFYRNESANWVLLGLGKVDYDGLIRHTCERYKDNPGVVQYHAEIRDDIPHKSPTNKGSNRILPKFVEKRIKNIPTEWTHQNVALFIAEEHPNIRVRYLPRSRTINALKPVPKA